MARGYSLDGIANVIYPSFQDSLSVNLNTLVGRDSEGKYMQPTSANATAANNYPIQEAGMLEVLRHGANGGNNVMQRYTGFSSRRLFIRSQLDAQGTWSDWDEYARMSEIYKQVYPVGAIYTCVNSVDPNTLFPGTTWAQITDGRVLRAATNNTVGTGDGNIGQTGGSETYTISASMMPVHSHTMAHTHNGAKHTHSIPAHAHSMAHTHSVPAHSHTASASTSVTVASSGGHVHAFHPKGDNGDGTMGPRGNNGGGGTGTVNTDSAGAHAHSASASTSVTVAQQDAMTTGGVSTDNTGVSAVLTSGNASATTTDGPSTGSTGNAGGTDSMTVTNQFRRVAVWQRTA